MKCNIFSQEIIIFHGRKPPEKGSPAGYAALYNYYNLSVPLPSTLCIISSKHKRYSKENWEVFTPRHKPDDTLSGHLTFALKYETLDLHILKELFESVANNEIENLIRKEPTSKYNRKIWFLYEWLLETKLNLEDIKHSNYVDLIDDKKQYSVSPINSPRHRIRNNLPGVQGFCPLIRKTKKMEKFINSNFSEKIDELFISIRKDILLRASAFLLLKDTKASYNIEGESPPASRLQRWGQIVGEAGKSNLSKEELLRLQTIVIEKQRFINMGWRKEGGFVGEHDRITGMPIPEHISAKPDDIEQLIDSMLRTYELCKESNYQSVLIATSLAFGFVFIHPFEDGNGRIHRYLIHHALAETGFIKKGYVFPVSFSMLEKINEYREVLESFSKPRLELIEWKETHKHNIEVINQTKDLYSYFDATKLAEFLVDCIEQTINEVLPLEIDYLEKYDKLKNKLELMFDMPDSKISLLIRFLDQNKGKFPKRALSKEFQMLTSKEIKETKRLYKEIFL